MTATQEQYDLALAWTWKYDASFVQCFHDIAPRYGCSLLEIVPSNLNSIRDQYQRGMLTFRYFLDRASDESDEYAAFANELQQTGKADTQNVPVFINPPDLIQRASDKATMHLEFLHHGIHVPYTIIISPFTVANDIELSLSELSHLGRPFIIKPANTTGGGIGVVMGAETLADVLEARKTHATDKYLLQEYIVPQTLNGERAWFRTFYVFGNVYLCWWNDQTHIYRTVTPEEEDHYHLGQLRAVTQKIADICQLDFFSTELVYTCDGRIVSVDYVNEMCDMRLQSEHPDGVPDEIVRSIVTAILTAVMRKAE